MSAKRVKLTARMLPDIPALIPVKAQSPKQLCQSWFASGRDIEPNPFADDLGQFVLPRQLLPQAIQDRFRGQATVGAMLDKTRLFVRFS